MSDLIIPAPLWRRLAASFYDGLLLMGLWMATLLLSLPVQHGFGLSPGSAWLRAALFIVGQVFFGWFWTRGGQTLGMRAWRLQVRRSDGAAVRWPIAMIRYVGLLAYWGLVLTPAAVATIARFPKLAESLPHANAAAAVASIIVLAAMILNGLDRGHRRLPQDWLSGTEVVQLPQNPSPPIKAGLKA